jgi:hypothetical protein
MTKLSTLARTDTFFYPLLFIAWAIIIFFVNVHYSYFGAPLQGVDLGAQQQNTAAIVKAMADTIAQERALLSANKTHQQRGHALETIGTAYFRMYNATRKRDFLDSAFSSCSGSLGESPNSPTAHYMLGEMSLAKNDMETAKDNFEIVLRIFDGLSGSAKNSPADLTDAKMAACFSSLRLAFIYSTVSVDPQKARERFDLYTKLEPDPQRRQASENEIRKFLKPIPAQSAQSVPK